MSDVAYCTIEDVYRYGVPSGALVRRALPIQSVDTAADALIVSGHGCSVDDPLEFAVEPGGALPAPLAVGTIYFAKPEANSDDLLQVAASPGGSAIDITTTGTPYFDLAPSVRPIIQAAINAVSVWIENRLPAHAVPLTPDTNGNYPQVVRNMCAVLAGEAALTMLGQANTAVSANADRMRIDAKMMLDGLPLRQVPMQRGITPAFGNHRAERRGQLP